MRRRSAVGPRHWLGMGGILAALVGCRAEGDRPGMSFLPDMVESIPYDAYDESRVARTGQTLRLPPEGTIPRGSVSFAYGPGPEEAARAGRELVSPIPRTEQSLTRGRAVFERICLVCHGPGGEGDGPIIGRFPNPPSLRADRAKALPDGHVYHIITRGQGIMPSHAAQVLPDDRWRVIQYLRELQGAAPPRAAALAQPGPTGGGA